MNLVMNIDMNLVPVLDLKRETRQPPKIDDRVMSENCDVIVFFLIYGQFTAIRKPNSGSMSIKLIFSLIVIFYPTEPENRTKKSLTQLLYYCFDYRYCFYQKILIFLRKKCILVRKGIFSETKYGFVLSYQISRF